MSYPHIYLRNKVVLVTGAATGIGRAIALEFGRAQASVILHYSHDNQRDSIATIHKQIVGFGGQAAEYQADFCITRQVAILMERTIRAFDGLDMVVNNAGITLNQTLENLTAEQCDLLWAVNVRAPLLITRRAAPVLKHRGGGSVINMSSVRAYAGGTGHSLYSATKGALVAMTKALAIELAPAKIRVNAIAPGWIETEYQHEMMQFTAEEIGPKIPAGRIGQPADVAHLAVWLASDQASYITGQTITIDGGMTSWLPVSEDWRNRSDAPFGRGYVRGR